MNRCFLLLLAILYGCSSPLDPQPVYDCSYRKGMNIFFTNSRNRFIPWEYEQTLSELTATGINSIYVVTFFQCRDEFHDSVYAGEKTVRIRTIRRIIDATRRAGIEPILKPHVNTDNGTPRYCMEPENPELWMDSYADLLIPYAELSEEYDLGGLVVGTELDHIVDLPGFRDRVIRKIRNVYGGELIYAASFDHFLSTKVWDHVDAIGVNAYFNLCKAQSCSQPEMVESWNHWLNCLDRFSLSKGKPVYITEVGYYSREGCAINPGDWARESDICFQEQAKAYEALLCQAGGFDSVRGVFWWQWELNNGWYNDSADYTPNDKPAEAIIEKYWANQTCAKR